MDDASARVTLTRPRNLPSAFCGRQYLPRTPLGRLIGVSDSTEVGVSLPSSNAVAYTMGLNAEPG